MTKLDHTAALVFAETYKTYTTGQEQPRNYNLAAAYLDLTQQLAEPCKRCNAYKTLVTGLEGRIAHHEERVGKYCESIATLQSERDANVLLTAEVNKLEAELAELRKAARAHLDAIGDVERINTRAALRKLLEGGE